MHRLLIALAIFAPAMSIFVDPATGQTRVDIKVKVPRQRCHNVPKYGHVSNVLRVFLNGFSASFNPDAPTSVQCIFQDRNGPSNLFIFNMKSQASNDFFSILVENGVVQDFFLTIDYQRMLAHHKIPNERVQSVEVICPGIKEQFAAGAQGNIGSAAPN